MLLLASMQSNGFLPIGLRTANGKHLLMHFCEATNAKGNICIEISTDTRLEREASNVKHRETDFSFLSSRRDNYRMDRKSRLRPRATQKNWKSS